MDDRPTRALVVNKQSDDILGRLFEANDAVARGEISQAECDRIFQAALLEDGAKTMIKAFTSTAELAIEDAQG